MLTYIVCCDSPELIDMKQNNKEDFLIPGREWYLNKWGRKWQIKKSMLTAMCLQCPRNKITKNVVFECRKWKINVILISMFFKIILSITA